MEYKNQRLERTKTKAQDGLKKATSKGSTVKVHSEVKKKGKKVGGTTVKTCV